MNPHRSPNKKQSINPSSLNYMQKYLEARQSPFSSKQESTKEQVPSKQHIITSLEGEFNLNNKQAFFKTKENQLGNKNTHAVSSQALMKYAADRHNKRKGRDRYDIKDKKSSQKYQEYFDIKIDNLRGVKQRPKFFKKISDSEDSQISSHSKNSVNSEGNMKFKYFSNIKTSPAGFHQEELQKKDNKFHLFQNKRNQFNLKKQFKSPNSPNNPNNSQNSQQFLTQNKNTQFVEKIWIAKNSTKIQQYPKNSPLDRSPNCKAFSPIKKSQPEPFNTRGSLSPQTKQKSSPGINYFNSKIVQRKVTPKKSKQKAEGHSEVKKNNWVPRQRERQFGHHKLLTPKKYDETENSVSFSKEKSQYFQLQNLANFRHFAQEKQYTTQNRINSPKPKELSKNDGNVLYLCSFLSETFKFIILSKLAQHKQTVVFLCLEAKMKQIYCIKKCKVSQNNLNQLIVEHKVGSFCSHPNLVKTFTSFFDRSYFYIVMEFMEGGTLLNRKMNYDPKMDRINSINARDTMNRLRQITMVGKNQSNQQVLNQILQGIKYLHSKRIIHRDIKPQNIYMSNGNYKIGDFGSSSFNNQHQYVGTLDYAAPEIMLKQDYDETIDIWSVGCIAYQLEVGRPPFYHYDRHETMKRIINVEYDSSLIINLDLKNLVSLMLVKNGSMRISASEALRHPYFYLNHSIQSVRNRI